VAITDNAFPGEFFDAVVAALVLDNVTREEMSAAVLRIRAALTPSGVSFCLFDPDLSCAHEDRGPESNSTTGITRVVYTDEKLRTAVRRVTFTGLINVFVADSPAVDGTAHSRGTFRGHAVEIARTVARGVTNQGPMGGELLLVPHPRRPVPSDA
jgi:hypothetical protein